MTSSSEQAILQFAGDDAVGNTLKDVLQHTIHEADRCGNRMALLLISIDHFKTVCRHLSTGLAEVLCQEIMARLGSCVPHGSVIRQCGDEEFALLLNSVEQLNAAEELCKNVTRIMDDLFVIDHHPLHLVCRIGITLYPDECNDAATMLRHASLALQRAKKAELGAYQAFSSLMNEQAVQRLALGNALSTVLAEGQLIVRYQPVVDLQTGKLTMLNALGWWEHPQLGNLSSERFMTIVEQSELIVGIGECTLRKVCEDMRAWLDQGNNRCRVAVNILPSQFRDRLFADKVRRILAETAIEPSMLSLEIAQSALSQDLMSNQLQLRKLKTLGVDLTLDEFGMGALPIAHLKHLPVDRIKVARSFVQNITTNASNAAISNAIISMAHGLGIKVAADGIDHEDQCDFMRRHMCDEIQGAFYGAPVAAGDVPAVLQEERRLPNHLLRIQHPSRTLLLVDDEPNILAALKRLLRRDGYEILAAGSGKEGLELLAQNEVDVIVSDQRMPGMTGVEFLSIAKGIYPDTVRIVLSGYTELQSVTDAVNEGAIYKFLTKPWEDRLLREHIQEAFSHKEMADENKRLTLQVRTANQELAAANRQMEELLQQKQQQITHSEISLDIAREVLQQIPLPVIGLDDDEMIVFVNAAAEMLFAKQESVLGSDARRLLPELFDLMHTITDSAHIARLGNARFQVIFHPMGGQSRSSGKLMTLVKMQD